MNTLLVRTLLAFLAALLILLGIMSLILFWGFQRSLEEWSRSKQAAVEDLVIKYLMGEQTSISVDVPLFIFSASKELVYSNRGRGRSIDPAKMLPVEKDGQILGYYYSGIQHFQSDAANQRLLDSLSRTLWLAFLISFLIALFTALVFSRSLSAPAKSIASGLDRIGFGRYDLNLPETGADEMARIARSANRLASQLSREQEIRRQWAQDVAHDLRTPVSVMKAQFEGMRDGVLDLSPERIDKSIREISRVESLISDLEELMSLESPEKKLERGEIKTSELIKSLQDRFAFEMQKKNIVFESRAGAETFTADRALIERALSNLLSNAVRHADEGGRIELDMDLQNEGVSCKVFNTGEAVPAQEIGRVFDRLYRGEYARKSPGSGLGLTIAKRIAELHGGSVKIESKKNMGTTVEISIPCGTSDRKFSGSV
jgi:two-component system sensor histidine kinase BaeS